MPEHAYFLQAASFADTLYMEMSCCARADYQREVNFDAILTLSVLFGGKSCDRV